MKYSYLFEIAMQYVRLCSLYNIVVVGKNVKSSSSQTKTAPTKDGKSPKPAEKKWTPQDEAAKKIQTHFRGFRARKKLEAKKKEKEDYEALMEKLEKEAGFEVHDERLNVVLDMQYFFFNYLLDIIIIMFILLTSK